MKSNSLLWTFALSFSLLFSSAQSEVLDADGDGIVGPHEVLELVRLWKQEATTGVTGNSWSLTGNSGTTPGTNFLGTADSVAFEIAVNGTRALRVEPTSGTPNLIGGSGNNRVEDGVIGAVIGGGGNFSNPNRVHDDFGTVGGGILNSAGSPVGLSTDARFATVGGGAGNLGSAKYST
ncbi:MAG: hypothetical protein KC994_21190, partial [Candidatus Omnitrophica bacterium]|nr:hypothetical protein [Candidatus Omnitrophota bacterium]